MILESIAVVGIAILLDLVFGDPRNRYHPTAWIGSLIGTITTRMKNENNHLEKVGGIFIVLIPVSASCIILTALQFSVNLINFELMRESTYYYAVCRMHLLYAQKTFISSLDSHIMIRLFFL